jgi:flagellar protein FlaG
MIDNTSSTVDAGSLTPQAKASAANQVKTANISELAKTQVSAPEKVVTHVSKTQESNAREDTEIAPEEMEQIVEKLNAFVQLTQRDVSFGVDEQSGRDVISVFESDTQELIRQIPSEEALALLKRMDKAIGLLFSERV